LKRFSLDIRNRRQMNQQRSRALSRHLHAEALRKKSGFGSTAAVTGKRK
jgi:hypothetical protein